MTARAQLNLRAENDYGKLDRQRAWAQVDHLRGKPHLILLIHGYNAPVDKASASYNRFCELQSQLVPNGLDWTFGATVVEVYWPGDAEWGIASPAFYPWAIPLADASAQVLGEILIALSHTCSGLIVDIVAHSMGNRVALQTAATVLGAGLQIRRCVHMAAAVRVDPVTLLANGLAVETADGKAESFYSAGDYVLAYAFPVGETAADPSSGLFPTALGHENWVMGRSVPNVTQWNADPAGHGDYWPGVRELQTEINATLDLSVTSARGIAGRTTPTVPPIEARQTPTRTTNA